MVRKITIKPYKAFRGKVTQYSYRGVAMTPVELAIVTKLNEIIDEINT